MLDAEKLRVYGTALEFTATLLHEVASIPRGFGFLTDQVRRSASSIVLNIAEGAGEFAPKEKARFYRMARRSASETVGALDLIGRLGLIEGSVHRPLREQLRDITSMLVGLIQRMEERMAT